MVDDLLYTDHRTGERNRTYHEIDFYKKQTRIALRNLGKIDQYSIDDFYRTLVSYQEIAPQVERPVHV